MTRALVIGGGPAGLMAAETLLDAGIGVTLAEAKPSLGRKLLMAGKSGLNLSKMEPFDQFLSAYRGDAAKVRPMLEQFGPPEVEGWARALGQEVFTGSSNRLYPVAMKASPLLRAWLGRLDQKGLHVNTRWKWQGWTDTGALTFATPSGQAECTPDITILALGGASWSRLGSDGKWVEPFRARGISMAEFQASNAGVVVDWSTHMASHFGKPIKNAVFRSGDIAQRGEAILSKTGLEGGGIYPLGPALRIGHPLQIDLFPDMTVNTLTKRLSKPRGKQSLSNVLRKALRLPPQTWALINEAVRPLPPDPNKLARVLKNLPIDHQGLRPMDEAISTAGGVPFEALTDRLELRAMPGTYCAGEMLDWDAPTGGYLLTACLATGLWAGQAAARQTKPD